MRLDLGSPARRLLGLVWVAAWIAVLYRVFAPWADLGGWVSERLRWLERLALFSGAVVGFGLAGTARELAPPDRLRNYVGLLRWLLYPAGVLTAAALVALSLAGIHDPVGVVLTAFLSYWAGVDLALGAFPLLEGRSPLDGDRQPLEPNARPREPPA